MASPVTTLQTQATEAMMPNTFVCRDVAGDTQITYHPCAWGPPVAGQENSPVLEYKGKEGQFCFTGKQVTEQDGRFGRIVTVDLPFVANLGATPMTFTMFMPPVILMNTASAAEAFQTFGVKARCKSAGAAPSPGAQVTFQMMHMQGTAQCCPKPL